MNENIVKQRIREILSTKESNPTKLAKEFSVNQKTLHNQINSDVQLSVSTLLLVLSAFPDVSTEWLMRGVGNMLLIEQPQQKSNPQASDAEAEIEKLKMQVVRLEAQNDLLREQVGMAETKRTKTA